MKKIETCIEEYFEKRLQKHPILIIYDPAQKYFQIAAGLADTRTHFIDGSLSTIEGREQAFSAWRKMSELSHETNRLVIYLPIVKPQTGQQKQQNPYQIFALGGGEFPDTDSESLFGLCLQTAPELRSQLETLFHHGEPDFETINNLLAGSTNWPKLKTILKAESAAEILAAALSPNAQQEKELNNDKSWGEEFRSFCAANLSFTPTCANYAELSHELWRFILFSEFAFNLPGDLPASLQHIPKAAEAQKSLVFRVCEDLRGTERHQMLYMQQAESVAKELQLEQKMQQYKDLGRRDTFAFEERTFLNIFCDAIAAGDYEKCENIIKHRRSSLWVRHLPDRQQLWIVAERALQLLNLTRDLEPVLQSARPVTNDLIDLYVSRFRLVDRTHRNFEAAVVEVYSDLLSLEAVIKQARQCYARASEKLQLLFISAVQAEGWPASSRMRSSEVFDKVIAPLLVERKKTAFFMVDALRYELAAELENELSGKYSTKLTPICAQLPTITAVGMASLLPSAQNKMHHSIEGGAILPILDGKMIKTPTDRFNFLQSIYGDRCLMSDLDDLLERPHLKVDPNKQLWVIKTTDIDDIGEMSSFAARQFISLLLRKLIAAIHAVKRHGFDQAIVATDHGFILLHEQAAGDVATKPIGEWTVIKDRFLMGTGSGSDAVLALAPEEVGTKGDFKTLAVPKSFAAFSRGMPYYHGGLSLQEALLPLLVIAFGPKTVEEKSNLEMTLSYRKGASGKITTRRPIIEISIFSDSLYSGDITFQLAAYAGERQVGEAAASELTNPETNWITARPGQAIRVPMKMADEFHGAFQILASDPVTKLTYATLDLETDYMD